jgi:uncharacterized protein YggE
MTVKLEQNVLASQTDLGLPTIQVSGTALRQLPPKYGVIQATIEEKASTQEAAWTNFQATSDRFRDKVGDHGTIKNIMPRESAEEVSRTLRSGMEYTVKAIVEVEFEPSAYGEILKALISSGLAPTTPRFVYDKTPSTSPELYTEATTKAKENARAVALGVDGRLGRLVSINIGPPRIKPVFRKQSEILFSTAVSMSVAREFNFAGLDEDKLETFDTEVQITVEFEIIENTQSVEAI